MVDSNNLLFVDTVFLRNFGLSHNNVLDYFALSPFYDMKSNNQAIRTQGASLENLVNMQGLEFIVDNSTKETNLFIIKKQMRSSPREAQLLDIYYVIDLGEGYFVIYKTPDLLEILCKRHQKTALYLERSFDSIIKQVEYTGSEGHHCFKKQRLSDALASGSESITVLKPAVREFPSFSSVLEDISCASLAST